MRWFRTLALGAAAITLAACGGGPGRAGATPAAAWTVYRHLPGVVDLAGPRADGSFLVAAAGQLFVLARDGTLRPFARGAGGYLTATGTEPYLVLASNDPVGGTRCSFGNDTAFALEPGIRPGVVMISPQGEARRFASLPPGRFLSGIAFDSTGRFGHRLLVSAPVLIGAKAPRSFLEQAQSLGAEMARALVATKAPGPPRPGPGP